MNSEHGNDVGKIGRTKRIERKRSNMKKFDQNKTDCMISKFDFPFDVSTPKYTLLVMWYSTHLMIMQAHFQSGDKLKCLENIVADVPECHSFDLCCQKWCKAYKVISLLFSIPYVFESNVVPSGSRFLFLFTCHPSHSQRKKNVTILNSWTPTIWRSRQPGPQFHVEYMQK